MTLTFWPVQHIQSVFVRIEPPTPPKGNMRELINYVCQSSIEHPLFVPHCWTVYHPTVRFGHDRLESFWHGSVYLPLTPDCLYCICAGVFLEKERELFYLTTHSTHFIYGYMASYISLRTILIVRKETRCRHISINSKGCFIMHHPTDRIAHTTAFVTPVVEHWLEREIAQWVQPNEGSIRRPIAPWANALPLSYVPLLGFFLASVHRGIPLDIIFTGLLKHLITKKCMSIIQLRF